MRMNYLYCKSWFKGLQLLKFVVLGGVGIALVSCQGDLSDKPPIDLNINMDFQSKKKAQQLSKAFPEGTVAYGYKTEGKAAKRADFLKADPAYYKGKVNNQYIKRIPKKVDAAFVKRGQKNFNIYCAACHDRVGTSQSIIVKKGVGIPPPPHLADARLIKMTDGELFEVISQGRRNMPSYSVQVDTLDRWAIVAYVRALQVARSATIEDVPKNQRSLLK